MIRKIVRGALAVLLVAVVLSAAAQAGSPYINGGWWGGWGGYSLYGSRVNDVPYFSMFPPVYYSAPVPRAYGWSPFAYPPGTMTPEVEKPQSQELINPYVPQTKEQEKTKSSSTRTASHRQSQPQVLINPYCDQSI